MDAQNFNFSVDAFEGDPALIEYFFDQVSAYGRIKKLDEEALVLFLKSKFKGPARKYLIENPILYKATSFDFIEKAFKKFFSVSSTASSLNDLNNLALLPHENIRNFAHRLNVLVTKVYPDISDKTATDNIKFVKLLACLPSAIKIKIQEENIKDYEKAVERAQTLQDIFSQDQILTNSTNSTSYQATDDIQTKLLELSEKINTLSFSNTSSQEHKQLPEVSQQVHRKSQEFKKNYKARNTYHAPPRYQNFQRNNNTRCQLCFRFGHVATNCFKWQRASTRQSQQQNYNYKQYDNFRDRNLNSK